MDCEKDTDTWFVKATGEKITASARASTTYFYCNRSGYFDSRGTGKRVLKSQGTSKLNGYCTASMTTITTETKAINVEYFKSHYGHQVCLGHLRISDSNRKAIAGQLDQGVSFEHIIDSIRNSVGSKFQRIHLVTRKDLKNIKNAFGIQSVQRHRDDATSIQVWVQEMQQSTKHNPVLLYKAQCEIPQNQCHRMSTNDFVLVLQTEIQAQMLEMFGPQRIVCIDDTHGTNGYNFTLITIMVVDEFGEGFPVAWCISNR